MRRISLASAALAVAVWACASDYSEDPNRPPGATTGAGTSGTSGTSSGAIEPANPPGIALDKIVVRRGETTKAPFTVTRAKHELALDVVANNVPAGITVAPVSVPTGKKDGVLEVTAETSATEGVVTIDLALLDGNDKIATASVIVEVAPLRAGSIDPSFGTNGFVDLDLPRSLLAFDGSGALYVLATNGLARWSKDGTRDAAYGPIGNLPESVTVSTMTVADNGQVYLAGYDLNGSTSTAAIVRTRADGKTIDPVWGDFGVATVPPSAPGAYYSAFGLTLTPTAVYAAAKLDADTGGQPGPTTIARLSLAGAPDAAYGSGGFITLPLDAHAPKIASFDPIGLDHFVVALGDVLGGAPFLRVYEGNGTALTPRVGDYGSPTALAYDGAETVVARSGDAGAPLFRVGDAGIDPTFAAALPTGTTVEGLTIDNGRILVTGCADASASWSRYLGDGGIDPDYRNGTSAEIDCILASRLTEKYLYIVGEHGTPAKLRVARLIR